jgi:DNA repair protein RecO (recombination protein O)
MPSYIATGITLGAHAYKGTQRIAAFFTRERGKVEATVSGVGKPGSKLAPAVEPLALSRLYLAEGRGLDRLAQCEVIESFYDLRMDLTRLAWASYAAELVDETTEPGHEEPEVFDALVATLGALTHGQQVELTAWGFVVRYLCLHGLAPALDVCTACGTDIAGQGLYVCSLGGCACVKCRAGDEGELSREEQATLSAGNAVTVSPRARAAMQTLGRLAPERLDRVKLAPGVLSEVREVLRKHIQYHVGVRLRSEEFLVKVAGG